MTAILLSIVLLFANGAFVGAEFAMIAARRVRMEQLAEGGGAAARVALTAMRELSLTLSAAQLGITAASLGLGYVAEPAVAHGLETVIARGFDLPDQLLHTISLVLALTIVVFLHMVIGEMVPKNIAIAVPERSALWLAYPMRAFSTLLRPAIVALTVIANGILRLLGVEPRDELATARTAGEIASMLAASHAEGVIDPARHDLMIHALDFRDREVGTLMVPWNGVVKLEKSTTVAGTERIVRESGHSRFPVLNAGPEDVLGFVHAKDLLRITSDDRSRTVPDELIRPMLVLRQTAKLNQALVRMRHTRTHFAVVTDGLRRPVGIVTLEDILESLVGPIIDEHDVRAPRRRARSLVRRRGGSRGRR